MMQQMFPQEILRFLWLLVFCVLQMKKDFLYQRQHDDVRRMLEKQVCTLQSLLKQWMVKEVENLEVISKSFWY